MRSCCAVYVDVGYLLAAAATRVTGSSLRRGVQADHAALIAWLGAFAEADSGLPLLRVNWYDAGGRPGGMPDASQDEIGQLPRVKLRLGRLSYSGEQKGVDVRIGLDLAIQARQRVADVVYLVSGDDDLTEAVEDAQSHGVQVVLLAVPRHDGKPLAVSKHLMREVDRSAVIDQDAIDAAFKPTAIPEALLSTLPDPDATPGAGSAEADAGAQVTDADTDVPAPDADTGEVGSTPAPHTGAKAGGQPRQRRRTVHGIPIPASLAPASDAGAGETTPTPAPTAPGPEQVDATTTTGPASPAPAAPSSPTPAMFARRKAGGVALPGTTTPVAIPEGEGVTSRVVDAVARQVVAAWCTSATPESLVTLRAGAPIIPNELDRALLVDLAGWSDNGDLDDETRHDLRARFWYHVERVKPV